MSRIPDDCTIHRGARLQTESLSICTLHTAPRRANGSMVAKSNAPRDFRRLLRYESHGAAAKMLRRPLNQRDSAAARKLLNRLRDMRKKHGS